MTTPAIRNLEIAFNVWARGARWIDSVVLVAGAAQPYTVPAGGRFLLIGANADFYANYNGAAAVPVATTSDGSASELNPTQRIANAADVISFISATNCIVTIGVYGS